MSIKDDFVIRVANSAQKVLVECELQGQISDGYWENASPRDHWRIPSGASVVVDAENPSVNFYLQRRYNFTSPELLQYVGDRMIQYVQMHMLYPHLSNEALRKVDCGDWWWDDDNGYYTKIIAEFAAVGITNHEQLQAVISNLSGYDMKAMKKDLKEIKVAFNTYKS